MEKLEHTVFQISELIGKERFGTLSEEENEVLEEWRRQSAEHETLYQKLQDTRYLSESVARLSGIDTRQPLLHMQRQIAGFTRRRQVLRLRQIGGVAALFLMVGSPAVFASATSGRPAHSGRRASCCFTFGKRRTHPFGYLATNDYTRRGQDF